MLKPWFVVLGCLLLQASECWHAPRVARHYPMLPDTKLYYQAVALKLPEALLRHYIDNPGWRIERQIIFLKQDALKHQAKAHYLIAKAYFDDGQYQRAWVWTQGSALQGDIENELLKAKVLTSLERYGDAVSLLDELANNVTDESTNQLAKAMSAKALLHTGQLMQAQDILKQNHSPLGKRIHKELKRLLSKAHDSASCLVNVQFVVGDLDGLNYASKIIDSWVADESVFDLPICFNAAQSFIATELNCIDEIDTRQYCDLTLMAEKLNLPKDTLPVVIHGEKGTANYNNGIIFTNHLKPYGVFKHELMHHMRFMDEYRLNASTAKKLCDVAEPQYVGENLLIVPKGTLAHQIPAYMVTVPACDETNAIAYKPVKQMTLMEFMDQPLPPLYSQKAKDRLINQADSISNYQYAYALAFARKGQMKQYRFWLNQSAQRGYAVAKSLLLQE